MRKPSIQMIALALVGMVFFAGCSSVSAMSRSNTAAHASTKAASVIVTQLRRAVSGHRVKAAFSLSTSARVVAVNCDGQGQVSPKRFALTCARASLPPGNYLTGLRWRQWGSRGFARGTGMEHPATCVGSTSVAVVLWRPRPWPGHAGQRYFTRITVTNRGTPTAWSRRTSTVHLEP